MTDNEQRAHDLAVALTTTLLTPEYLVSEAIPREKVNVDVYAKYKGLYESILKALNRDYPE